MARLLVAVFLACVSLQPLAQDAPTIGVLGYGSREGAEPGLAAFREGLKAHGLVEGKNLRILYRQTTDHTKLPALADELVRAKVKLIFARGMPEAHAAKAATDSIPIVFALVTDPVLHGFADSFARPGHNMTGVSVLAEDMANKRLEIAHDAYPRASKLAVLVSEPHREACGMEIEQLEGAARKLGVGLVVREFSKPEGIAQAVEEARRAGAGAVMVPVTVSNADHIGLISRAAAQRSMPTIQDLSSSGRVDALIAYGPEVQWTFGRAGYKAGQILKGAKAGDLPIERPHRYELVANREAARSQHLNLPEMVLLRATRVIE
jgi:putative ABC transport system substrate-binding protein